MLPMTGLHCGGRREPRSRAPRYAAMVPVASTWPGRDHFGILYDLAGATNTSTIVTSTKIMEKAGTKRIARNSRHSLPEKTV